METGQIGGIPETLSGMTRSTLQVTRVPSPGPLPCRNHGGSGRSLTATTESCNGIQVDQGVARKAKQKSEGEMEGTKTAAASEAP